GDGLWGGLRLEAWSIATELRSSRNWCVRVGSRCCKVGECPVREDERVETGVQLAGIELLRIDDRERELELLEEPANPARRHRTPVDVHESDTRCVNLQGF